MGKVKNRIQGQLARAADLQAKDRELSNKLYREQLQLAAQMAERRAAERARAYSDGGREDRGPVGGSSPGPTGANVPLCTVGGITVNCQIEGSLTSMLNAARADGVSLSGGGWRDPAAQIALRREHCGSSHYAIYEMSPSACSAPDRPTGAVDARGRAGHRLLELRQQQLVLPLAQRQRRWLRVHQPALRTVALERERPVGRRWVGSP